MTRKHLLTALQFALAVGLLTYVLSGVPWRDVAEPKAGVEASRVVGSLVENGLARPWSAGEVVLETETGPVAVTSASHEVRPGLFTLARHLDPLRWGLGTLLLLVGAFVAFTRWWLLVRCLGIPFTFGEAVKWSFVGLFFNNVVPGLVGGDLPKMYFVARHAPVKTHAVLTVAVDRLLGLFGLALVAGVALLCDLETYRDPALRVVALPIVLVFVATLVALGIGASARLRGLLLRNRLVMRLPGSSLLMRLDEACALYRKSPGLIAASVGLSCVNHVLSMIAWWCFDVALGGQLTLGAAFVVIPLLQIAKSVPISPAGVGWGEWLASTLLPRYGEDPTIAVALSLTYTLTYMAFSLVGGLCLLATRDRVSAARMQQALEDEPR